MAVGEGIGVTVYRRVVSIPPIRRHSDTPTLRYADTFSSCLLSRGIRQYKTQRTCLRAS